MSKKLSLLTPSNTMDYQDCQDDFDSNNASLIKSIINKNVQLKNETLIIKLASSIIKDDQKLNNFVENIKVFIESGAHIIIVHDYAGLISSSLEMLSNQGIKIADYQSPHVSEMVVSGYINKRIVSALCKKGCFAIGISGKDAHCIRASKIQSCNYHDQKKDIINVEFYGDPILINPEIFINFIDLNTVIVVSPVSSGVNDVTYLLNVEMTATLIAGSLNAKHLVLLTELGEMKIDEEPLHECTINQVKKLHYNNRIPQKYNNIMRSITKAFTQNVNYVYISNAYSTDTALLSIFSDNYCTKINMMQ